MWRRDVTYFSRYTSPLPNAARASAETRWNSSWNRSRDSTTWIPLPPPPWTALISTG